MGPADEATSTIAMVISGRLARADVPAMLERIGRLLEGTSMEGTSTGPIFCDVAAVIDPDLFTVDALAALQLWARRLGRPLRFRHASPELRELIALAGLSGTLPCREELLLEVQRQPEEGEEAGRVQEECDAADPAR